MTMADLITGVTDLVTANAVILAAVGAGAVFGLLGRFIRSVSKAGR